MTRTEAVKKELTEALISDEITPSASRRIAGMIEEFSTKNVLDDERLDAIEREFAVIMNNLRGPTVEEIKDNIQRGDLGIVEMFKLWVKSYMPMKKVSGDVGKDKVKNDTHNSIVAWVYLAIILAAATVIYIQEWNTLREVIVVCLAGYGVYAILEKTEVGNKLLILITVGPVVLFFTSMFIWWLVGLLGAMIGWLPWTGGDQPIYGAEILEYPWTAVFLFITHAFWAVIAFGLIYVLRDVFNKRKDRICFD